MRERAGFLRTVIMGNGGSGKSWLAERLAVRLGCPVIDLDQIHWEPGGYNHARDKDVAKAAVRDAASAETWIIEGVYGWLVGEALPSATALIWLVLDDAECIANVKHRGPRGSTEVAFEGLLTWVADYRVRQNANSFWGHQRIFASFDGTRLTLQSRAEIGAFLQEIEPPSQSAFGD